MTDSVPHGASGIGPEPTGSASGSAAPDPWSVPVDVSPDIVPGAPIPPSARPRGRGFVVLTSAAVAAVLVGGAGLAWAAFNGNTGDQPEKHLPASAGAVLKLDLDPSGGQKIDAVRFFAKFPFGKGLGGTDDPREYLYEQLTQGRSSAPPWSSVQPWLGQRAAVAAVPGSGSETTTVVLLQVTDEGKARAGLEKIKDGTTAFTVADGWATISDTQAHVDAITRGAATKSLADDPTFRADLDTIGDPGVLSGWGDPQRFPALTRGLAQASTGALALPQALTGGQDALEQRYAMAARFSGGNAELVVRTFGPTSSSATGAGRSVAELPEGTVAAFGVSGAGDMIRKARPSLDGAAGLPPGVLSSLQDRSGLKLPDDLVALLGEQAVLALAEPDASGRPVLGLKGRSSSAGLGPALDRLLRFTDASGLPLEKRTTAGGYVLATSRGEAEALAAGGRLGDSAAFRDAVPDADQASVVAYVDVQRVLSTYAKDVDQDTAAGLEPLRAVGVAVTPAAGGTTTTIRVTTR